MDNHSIISRRFKNLRESKKDSHGKELPMSQLAEILCNEKFIENYTSEAIRQEIRKVEQKNKFPQLFLIKAYSNYFNVTADYLLGIRDNAVVDENIAMIGKTTGLSDNSISTLKRVNTNWNPREIKMLNYIMTDTYSFLEFLKWLSIYIDNQYTIPITHTDKGLIQCGYTVNGENAIELGKKIKDNKGNDGYESIGVGVDILESHAMLQMQKIMNQWRDSFKNLERK